MKSARTLWRAVRGYLGSTVVVEGELPEEHRPVRLAVRRMRAAEPAPTGLTLLTYNLQRCYREPTVTRSLADVVTEHSPDLILLQEAPRGVWEHPELAPVLADHNLFYAPFHQILRPDGRYPHSDYGQLLATPWSLDRPQVIELPTVTRATLGRHHLMKRIALYGELPTADGRRVRVVNAHNEPFVWPRRRQPQFRAVMPWLEPREPGTVGIYAGDLNAVFGERREPGLRRFREAGWERALKTRGRSLDNCLAAGHRRITGQRLSKPGSDHRPVVVRVEW